MSVFTHKIDIVAGASTINEDNVRKLHKNANKTYWLYLLLVIFAAALVAPDQAFAAPIGCGGCHSTPPSDTDSEGCLVETAKSHLAHSSADTSTCLRCHPAPGTVHAPGGRHYDGLVNVTSLPGLGMNYTKADSTCTSVCHKNENSYVWGGSLDCNSCHFRSGAQGNYIMSGQHMASDRSFRHFSSPIKVTDNTKTITCANCHPVNGGDNTAPRSHINSASFDKKADMSEAHTYVNVSGVGIVKGATAADATCSNSCHYNGTDTFGLLTTYFRPGQKVRFGPYQSSNWGSEDLNCNECHSSPSQSASFGGSSSVNADKHHTSHMFKYKLAAGRYANDDKNIYCYDCHRLPDMSGTRGFKGHSTTGQGGSGMISLPVKSGNAKVNIAWRNGNVGHDGINPPAYDKDARTCDNVYCHTAISSATWTDRACDDCHGVRGGVLTGSGAPGYRNWTTPATYPEFQEYAGGGGAHYLHVFGRGYTCNTCHSSGGKDGNPANHNQGAGTVIRANVNVGMETAYWFNGVPSSYDTATRTCLSVNCHYGTSRSWDCEPLH